MNIANCMIIIEMVISFLVLDSEFGLLMMLVDVDKSRLLIIW